jgi:hypothetical protein
LDRPLNPFDPSHPIPPGQFVGREQEIEELKAALTHAKRGRPRHFLITGDRGAGKTSFLDYLRTNATSRAQKFNFIVVDFAVDQNSTRLDLARTIQDKVSELLAVHSPIRDLLGKTWAFIQRFEAAGISYNPSEPSPENHREIIRSLADSLCKVVSAVCVDVSTGEPNLGYDGVLLLIDEVDQSSDDLDIGTFLKLLLERLNSVGCRQVVVGLAGLHSTRQVLIKSHPSSLRVFDELPLDDLKSEDIEGLLAHAELQVRNEGYDRFSFSSESIGQILEFSGGHAHFVHQFGYCAFEKACRSSGDDFRVEATHVMSGAFEPRGALELIGDMYFQVPYERMVDNNAMLAILDRACESPSVHFSVEAISAESRLDIQTTRSALNELTELSILVVDKASGLYRIRHRCFAYWLKQRRPS